MPELSNETTSMALKLSEKALDVLMQFFKFLMQREERKVNAELKKEQLNQVKLEKRGEMLKLQGKVGYVKAKILQSTGEPLVALNLNLSDKQMKEFASSAKKYGLLYTSFGKNADSDSQVHTFFIREKDLAIAKRITDNMTLNLQIKTIEDKEREIRAKEVLTEKDLKELESLERQKEDILNGNTAIFNNENAQVIFNDVCGKMQEKSLSFDEALNRYTDRDFARKTPYYLCERTNPVNYIELSSVKDTFRGKTYTKTDYRVFHNESDKGNYTDKRFEGRPRGYWQDLRENMKEQGGFSDDVVMFNNIKQFEEYKTLFKQAEARSAIHEDVGGEYRDYASIITVLNKQLETHNVQLNENGIAIDGVTQLPLSFNENASMDERLRVSESIAISNQIANYSELVKAQVRLEMDRQENEVLMEQMEEVPPTDARRSEITNKLSESDAKMAVSKKIIENCLDKEKALNKERSQMNGIEAANGVQEHLMSRADNEHYGNELDKLFDTQTMDEWKEQIKEQRASISQSDAATQNLTIDKVVSAKEER